MVHRSLPPSEKSVLCRAPIHPQNLAYYAELFKYKDATAPVSDDGLGSRGRAGPAAGDSSNLQGSLDGDVARLSPEVGTVREELKADNSSRIKGSASDEFAQVWWSNL